jgi:hypothetical protein
MKVFSVYLSVIFLLRQHNGIKRRLAIDQPSVNNLYWKSAPTISNDSSIKGSRGRHHSLLMGIYKEGQTRFFQNSTKQPGRLETQYGEWL